MRVFFLHRPHDYFSDWVPQDKRTAMECKMGLWERMNLKMHEERGVTDGVIDTRAKYQESVKCPKYIIINFPIQKEIVIYIWQNIRKRGRIAKWSRL